MQQDYVRTARAKGLRERNVLIRHGFRNALIPVITVLGLQMSLVVGGAIVIESFFGLPGVGKLIHRFDPLLGDTHRAGAGRDESRSASPSSICWSMFPMPTSTRGFGTPEAGMSTSGTERALTEPAFEDRERRFARSRDFARRFARRPVGVISLIVVLLIAFAAIFTNIAATHEPAGDPDHSGAEAFAQPSTSHILRHRPARPRHLLAHRRRLPHRADGRGVSI